MRTIEWKISLNEDTNQIATMEHAIGFPQEEIESHLTIVGLLENLKQNHLRKLSTLYEKTEKGGRPKDFDKKDC